MEKESQPLVSVIITTYNRKNLLPNAISSVLKQTLQDFEIIVVNDNGEDVKNVIDKFGDNRIKHINKDKNCGLGAARNTGLDNATGKFVNFLDDDDWFGSHHLQILSDYLLKTGNKIAYTDCICNVQEKNEYGNYYTKYKQIVYSLNYDPLMILWQNITPVLGVMYDFQDNKLNKVRHNEEVKAYEDWIFWLDLTEFYPMHHLDVATCSYVFKHDGTTMSSSRNEFTTLLPMIYSKYWKRAENNVLVARNMNYILQQRGLQPMFTIIEENKKEV